MTDQQFRDLPGPVAVLEARIALLERELRLLNVDQTGAQKTNTVISRLLAERMTSVSLPAPLMLDHDAAVKAALAMEKDESSFAHNLGALFLSSDGKNRARLLCSFNEAFADFATR